MPLPALAAILTRLAPAAMEMFGEGAAAGLVGRGAATDAAEAGAAESGAAARAATAATNEYSVARPRMPSASDIFGVRRSTARNINTAPQPKVKPQPLSFVPNQGPRLPTPFERTFETPAATSGHRGIPSASDQLFNAPPAGGVIDSAQRGDEQEAKRKRAAAQQDEATGKLKKFGEALLMGTGNIFGTIKAQIKLAAVFWGATKGLEAFVGLISESRRGLADWNGKIAASFAKLDIRRMRQDITTAQGVSGSTAGLNVAYGDLLDTMQPLKQDMMTMVNIAGIAGARLGQLTAWVSKFLPVMMALRTVAEKIEGNTRRGGAVDDDAPAKALLKALINAKGAPPPGLPAVKGPPAPLPPIV